MTTLKKITLFSVALIIISAIGWHIWSVDPNANAPIRIGINPWMGYEFLYLAEQKGMFAEEGLNVRLLQYNSLEDVRGAFERAHVDGITSTVAEVIQVNAQGKRKAQVVLVADFSNGADVMLARPPITSLLQLKGKRIAVEKASLGMFMLARALEKSGMSLDDVEILAYDQPDIHRAIDAGEIDAAVTYPPFSIELIRHDQLNKIFDSSRIPGEVLDTVSLDSALLKKNPELATKLMRVWDRSLAYAKANPKESNRIMAARENITVEEFEAGLSEIHVVETSEQAELLKQSGKLEHAILLMGKILHRSGELKQPVVTPGDYIFRSGK